MSLRRIFGKTNFIRRSLRYRVFKKMAANYKFEVNFYGYRYTGNLDNFIDRSVFFFGAHEREQLEFSEKFIKDKIVFDCGANFGNHSLFYSHLAKSVISIEPNTLALNELKTKIDFKKSFDVAKTKKFNEISNTQIIIDEELHNILIKYMPSAKY
jgi:hypothetical protein